MGADGDFPDVGNAVFDLRMQRHRALGCRLRMELGRERNLEQHMFHHIGAVGALELEFLAFE